MLSHSYPVSSMMASVILENTLFCVCDPVMASFCENQQLSFPRLELSNQKCQLNYTIYDIYRGNSCNGLFTKKKKKMQQTKLSLVINIRMVSFVSVVTLYNFRGPWRSHHLLLQAAFSPSGSARSPCPPGSPAPCLPEWGSQSVSWPQPENTQEREGEMEWLRLLASCEYRADT